MNSSITESTNTNRTATANIIHLDETVYFPYRERAMEKDWRYSRDVYLQLEGREDVLEFHIGDAQARSINQQLADTNNRFLVFSSDAGATSLVSKPHIKRLTIQPGDTTDYPPYIVGDDGDYLAGYTQLNQRQMDESEVLAILASMEEEESSRIYRDFEFIVSMNTRLNRQIPRAIKKISATKPNYYRQGNEYRCWFLGNWGCRYYFNTDEIGNKKHSMPKSYFEPGFAGPDIVGGLFKQLADPVDQHFVRVSTEIDHIEFFPIEDLILMEVPTLFLGLDTYMRKHAISWKPQSNGNVKAQKYRSLITSQ